MSDDDKEQQDATEVKSFLQKLSRDKHAFSAHLGMRVERDLTSLEKNEKWLAAKERNKRKQP